MDIASALAVKGFYVEIQIVFGTVCMIVTQFEAFSSLKKGIYRSMFIAYNLVICFKQLREHSIKEASNVRLMARKP